MFLTKNRIPLVLSHEWRTKITSKTASSLFSGLSRRGFLEGLPYNVRHKSLKQEPFVLNFLQIFYNHSFPPVLTQMWPSPSLMLSRAYFHWRGKSLKCFKICDEYCSSIAGVFFSPFWGRRKLETLYTSRRWWARRPLIFRQVDGITALERRFYSLEVRWRFASFART